MQLGSNTAHTKNSIRHFHRMKLPNTIMQIPVIIKTVDSISSQLSRMPKSPSGFEIEDTYRKLLSALENGSLASVNNKDWKIAAYVLWYGNEKLGNKPEFLDFYIKWLNSYQLPSNWRKLIYVYLKDFGCRLEHPAAYIIMSKAIRSAFTRLDLKSRLEQWGIRHQRFGLFAENFDVKEACQAFTIDANLDWEKFSTMTGLTGELSVIGYAEAIGTELLNKLSDNPDKESIIAVQQYHLADKKMRFSDKRIQIIEALLAPWVKGGTSIEDDVRKSVQEWLLAQFHDPRLPVHNRDGWRGVSDEYKKVMFRWLTGASLDQFFEIIDQVAQESQWKYRKAFWKAYYDSGVLPEAWVAFGSDAKYYAEKSFGNKLSAGGLNNVADRKHSVLIVRIGDLMLADWSHNGKCRAWKIDDPSCPELYKMEYSGVALKAPSMKIVETYKDGGITHNPSETYGWQNKLADFIYDQTGIRIQQRDFRI